MGWTIGWLIFGLIGAHEAGELAAPGRSDAVALRALLSLLGSGIGLFMVLRIAMQRATPRPLFTVLIMSLLLVAGALWWLYGDEHPASGVGASMAGAGWFSACALAALAGIVLAWRRHARQARLHAQQQADRERLTRLERIRVQARTDTQNEAAVIAGDDYKLPERPKWEDS